MAIESSTTRDGFRDNPVSSKPQKIIIEHKSRDISSSPRSPVFAFGLTKPAVLVLGVIFLIVGGLSLLGWLLIPDMTAQIKNLEEEVKQLTNEVDRLESENNRYESLNDELNGTVSELGEITETLENNSTELVSELREVTAELDSNNIELKNQIINLNDLNVQYAESNKNLTVTTERFEQEIEYFENEVLLLQQNISSLSNLTNELGNLTLRQELALVDLHDNLDNITTVIDSQEVLNAHMNDIVDFLNERSIGFEASLETVNDALAEQLEANKVLVMESLENTYRAISNDWDCEYRDVFKTLDWGVNYSLPITDLDDVVAYLDERVLDKLCCSFSNFLTFLNAQYPDGIINTYQLNNAVGDYSNLVLDYYFPESDETGLTTNDWSDASYSCENLEEKYKWEPNIFNLG